MGGAGSRFMCLSLYVFEEAKAKFDGNLAKFIEQLIRTASACDAV